MNKPRLLKADICVIGAGAAGLSMAAGAAQLGARTVLIERGEMGGDCLNYGCVPSKALLAAAKAARRVEEAQRFGINTGPAEVDFAAVKARVFDIIAAIAPHDSQERFEGLGATVLRGQAKFISQRKLDVDGCQVKARRFVIAAGSRPAVPPIPGLETVPYLTNETIFALAERPRHLIIVGGGPIGMELAQAHVRLGVQVTVVERLEFLNQDDGTAAAVVMDALKAEGVRLIDRSEITSVAMADGEIVVKINTATDQTTIRGSHLLLAAGRRPNVEDLGLAAAKVAADAAGIKVDRGLRTANRRIYAIGDVTGGLQFTHVAGYEAGLVIRSALFRLPVRASYRAVPWVTYTDPELAHVGLREDQARARHGEVAVTVSRFADNDRARAEGHEAGFIKVVSGHRGRILGATIVGSGAGELIGLWALAIDKGLKMADIARFIAPYPTMGEISKRVAGAYFADRLFAPKPRRLVKALSFLG